MVSPIRPARFVALALAMALLGFGTVACSSGPGGSSANGKTSVVASFYPLAWMAERVGGDFVDVRTLTKPGVEPHDVELTPGDVADVQRADVVAYLSEFQPSVDDAVKQAGDATVFDARDSGNLDLTYTPIEEGRSADDEAGATDPHFWLDPTRLAKVAKAFAQTMAEADPEHAVDFDRNAEALTKDLAELDDEYRTGLTECANPDLVTSHNAFGYLAQRYDLRQVGITGLTPDQEPSPKDLADVTTFVEDNDVETIYFETLVSPRIAEAVAAEAGAETEVLDPLEGLTDRSQGSDYLEVMRSNLANIRTGQPCT